MGGKKAVVTSTRINNLAVQSSALGVTIPKGWGTNRIKCNIIWYNGFKAITHTEKSGGKGGGGVKQVSYTYEASIILGLAVGPIKSVKTVYRDKDVFTGSSALSQSGLSLATGTINQPVWSYVNSVYPSEALNYSNLAYVYAANYALNDSAGVPNHSFEVEFDITASGLPDANPADIVEDFFYNEQSGVPGWGEGLLDDLTNYRNYTYASDLLLSPVLEDQQQGTDFLNSLSEVTNSNVVWSEGKIKIVPRGDEQVHGNGVTWVPDLTPVYDLNEADFVTDDPEDPPVTMEIKDQSDCYNIVQIEYLDRSNQYNTAVITAQDLDDIISNGKRKEDVTTYHQICKAQVAQQVAQLRLQRSLYTVNTYKFRLPWDYVLLEPSDLVTLSTQHDELMLDRVLVRILEIEEDEEGTLSFTAEEVAANSASASLYPPQTPEGYVPDTGVSPGSVINPVIVNAPTSLTGGAPEVWIGAGSSNPDWGGCEVWVSADGTNYSYVERILQPARYGVLTSGLPSATDPNPSGTFNIDTSSSRAIITAASVEDLDTATTLSFIVNPTTGIAELVAYKDVGLVTEYNYTLSNLRRALYGTTPQAHSSGARFLRVDDNVFSLKYESLGLGKTAYIKLLSFNVWGKALQGLEDVSEYVIDLVPLSVGKQPLGSFSLVTNENVYVDGSTVQKIAGGDDWNGYAYSRESFTNGAFVSFVADQNDKQRGVGFSVDPTSGVTKYGILLEANGFVDYQEDGSFVSGGGITYNAGDIFSITYDGSSVVYKKNGTAIRTVVAAGGLVLYMNSSFYHQYGSISSLSFASVGKTGTDGLPGTPGADGVTYYSWYAYADSADGQVNFATGSPGNRVYQGVAHNKTSPTESTNPADYTWSPYVGPPNFGLAARNAKAEVASNKIMRRVATSGGWDTGVYSTESYVGGAAVTFALGSGYGAGLMVGLNTDPAGSINDWSRLDYALYPEGGGVLRAAESGSLTAIDTWVQTDIFTIHYNGAQVIYYKNGTVIRTVSATANQKFFMDSVFGGEMNLVSQGEIISWQAAGPKGDQGPQGPEGPQGPQGPSGANGTNGTNGRDAVVFYQDAVPSGQQVGDTWCTVTLPRVWRRWNGSSWVQLLGNVAAYDQISASQIAVTQLSAISANIGLLRTAASGARVEIEDNKIRGYYASGNLAFFIGVQ